MPIRLKSRRECPPNGFQYTQKETGWHQQTWDFAELCRSVQAHRQANPKFKLSLDLDQIAEEVDLANAIRVSTIPGADIYLLKSEGGVDASALGKSIPQRLKDVAVAVVKLNSGRSLIAEWKAQGFVPVAQEEANRRAEICAGCPQNGTGDLTRWFTVPASERIKKEIEAMRDEKLTTPFDDKLGVCEACLCPLRLKVHTPMPLILKHLTPEAKAALDKRCWILK